MSKHLNLGKHGELLARNFLIDKNYKLLEINYKYQKFEIDIIALKNEVLVFVEVKTRSTDTFGSPDEAVGFIKEQHIAAASEGYIIENDNLQYIDIQFDIISIVITGRETSIRHIEDAFFPRNF